MPAQIRLLDGVFAFGHESEHAVGQPEKTPPVRLERRRRGSVVIFFYAAATGLSNTTARRQRQLASRPGHVPGVPDRSIEPRGDDGKRKAHHGPRSPLLDDLIAIPIGRRVVIERHTCEAPGKRHVGWHQVCRLGQHRAQHLGIDTRPFGH